MSDEAKMKPLLQVKLTSKGAALAAAKRALRAGGQFDPETVAYAIAEAIEAYEQERSEAHDIVERVTVLAPKPGDVVMIQLRETANMDQIEEFCQVLNDSLPSTIVNVQFIGATCFEGIKIVRGPGREGDVTDGN